MWEKFIGGQSSAEQKSKKKTQKKTIINNLKNLNVEVLWFGITPLLFCLLNNTADKGQEKTFYIYRVKLPEKCLSR